MISEMERRPIIGTNEGSFDDELEEIGLLLQEQRRQEEADEIEHELNLYRSGSAPPSIEGSLSAVGGLFGGHRGGGETVVSESQNGNGFVSEEVRSDPAYLSYYYSNANLNPRLPPPSISKEDWRSAQRVNGGGSSLFSMPPGFTSRKQETEAVSERTHGSTEWGEDGLIGLPGVGLGSKQKSLAEIFQDDLGRSTPMTGLPSRPTSRNAFNENVGTIGSNESELTQLHLDLASSNAMHSSSNGTGPSTVQSIGPASSFSYAAVLGASLSRGNTPDPQLVARAPSCPPIGGGRVGTVQKRTIPSPNSYNEAPDLVSAFSGMNLSANGLMDDEMHFSSHIENEGEINRNYLLGLQGGNNLIRKNSFANMSESMDSHRPQQFSALPAKSYLKGSPKYPLNGGSQYQPLEGANSSFPTFNLGGRSINNPSLAQASALGLTGLDPRGVLGGSLSSQPSLGAVGSGSQNIGRMGSQMAGDSLQAPFVDPISLQYLRSPEYVAAQLAALNDPSMDRNYLGNQYANLLELQKAYIGALLSPQKTQYGAPLNDKSGFSNHHGYMRNPAYGGAGMSYPRSPMASPILSNSPGSPIRHNDLNLRFPSGMSNLAGAMGQWHLDSGYKMEESFASSLLEEFKSNKIKNFELSEIAGHVDEFSTDQYGSRFIQQKLETATVEEKTMVYQEIMPQALAFMTDVFGNYVIQKFFEHGLPSQRRELANKLFSHVLTLSLQMYGCRVIQKAIEVVDLDQKIIMVEELDGHIMRCIRDQNGNHVIQKCIECVPEDSICFIISTFFGQVVTLSTHPYGCRVIQRVLEHCKDPETQSKVMEEILGSVSMLAQDQYGNYVVQHVLEHGKPDERSFIIKELAGKIVQMSQQKFASNVVEKCLTFGGPAERQLLVSEMLGTTDENEPLQAMMKDQFANYVVQKVLETCDDQQRELILSRIKVHLNALKKYTYGKHIVARVEKLVAAGERRIAAQYLHPALVA